MDYSLDLGASRFCGESGKFLLSGQVVYLTVYVLKAALFIIFVFVLMQGLSEFFESL